MFSGKKILFGLIWGLWEVINHRIDIACDITDGVGPSGAFLKDWRKEKQARKTNTVLKYEV